MKRQRNKNIFTCYLPHAILVISIAVSTGCSSIFTSRDQKEELMKVYVTGKYEEAMPIMEQWMLKREGTGDELMWRLEEGTLKFEAGDYRDSLKSYEKCEELINNFDERAALNARKAGAETGAVVTNQNALPYAGFNYDRILLNAYKALDYFAIGDKQGATVELRRADERQKEAQVRFEEEIKKAEAEIKEKNKEVKGESKESGDLTFKEISQYAEVNASVNKMKEKSNKTYGNFVNPFVTYLSAIVYLANHNVNEANVDFRNLFKSDMANPLIQRDYVTTASKLAEKIPDELSKIKPYDYPLDGNVIFVIFENGMAPALKEVKFEIILPPPIPTGYSGISYGELEYFPTAMSHLEVSDSKNNIYKTVTVADMDAVVSQEYGEIFPYIITRLVISTIAKEVGSFVAQMAMQSAAGDVGKWGTVVATSLYKYAFNTADTRCWQTLPKQYQIVHFPCPSDGVIKIRPGNETENSKTEGIEVRIEKKRAIIHVKHTGQGNLSVRVFEYE